MKNTESLRQMSEAELNGLSHDLEGEIFALRCENAVQRKLEKPHLLRMKKRQRARVLTLLREKK